MSLKLPTDNGISFAAPWDVQEPKSFQLQGGFAPWPPTRGSAPKLRWGLRPQTPVIGSRSTRSLWPRPLLAPPTFKHFQRPWPPASTLVVHSPSYPSLAAHSPCPHLASLHFASVRNNSKDTVTITTRLQSHAQTHTQTRRQTDRQTDTQSDTQRYKHWHCWHSIRRRLLQQFDQPLNRRPSRCSLCNKLIPATLDSFLSYETN